MKQRKLALSLLGIVLLPLVLLGWQSWQRQQDSVHMQQVQAQQLADLRLQQVAGQVQAYFSELAQQLQQQVSTRPEQLAQDLRQDGRIQQIFVVDTQRQQRLWPAADVELSQQEQQFLQRWQHVWQDPQLLLSQQAYSQAELSPNSLSSRRSIKAALAPLDKQGWYSSYWQEGIHILYWSWQDEQRLVGIELELARVKADLISLLPDTAADKSQNHQMRLLDTQGQVVYQWGLAPALKQPSLQQTQLLQQPLSTWSLSYHAKLALSGERYILLWLFIGVALLISGLGYFLYREQSREIRLAQQRVQFVSQVSHELKTPLTNVRMYAELLEDTLEDEPQQQRYLHIIVDESQRLTRLIQNVLNFSRQPRLHVQAVCPHRVIRQVAEHFRPSLQAKGMALTLDLQAQSTVLADTDALEQILNNLLSNAEKYASQGQQVQIISRDVRQQVSIQVRDFGEGISPRERKRIFQPFYRIHNQLSEGVSGTGIGLTIAQQQAERLGGSLQLVVVEQGACFELRLAKGGKDENSDCGG